MQKQVKIVTWIHIADISVQWNTFPGFYFQTYTFSVDRKLTGTFRVSHVSKYILTTEGLLVLRMYSRLFGLNFLKNVMYFSNGSFGVMIVRTVGWDGKEKPGKGQNYVLYCYYLLTLWMLSEYDCCTRLWRFLIIKFPVNLCWFFVFCGDNLHN